MNTQEEFNRLYKACPDSKPDIETINVRSGVRIKEWHDDEMGLHRSHDLPARICYEKMHGIEYVRFEFYIEGRLFRENGPAIMVYNINSNGNKIIQREEYHEESMEHPWVTMYDDVDGRIYMYQQEWSEKFGCLNIRYNKDGHIVFHTGDYDYERRDHLIATSPYILVHNESLDMFWNPLTGFVFHGEDVECDFDEVAGKLVNGKIVNLTQQELEKCVELGYEYLDEERLEQKRLQILATLEKHSLEIEAEMKSMEKNRVREEENNNDDDDDDDSIIEIADIDDEDDDSGDDEDDEDETVVYRSRTIVKTTQTTTVRTKL
jgi:hypothetical protein